MKTITNKKKSLFSKSAPEQLSEKEILISDLKRIQRQIHQVNLLFNLADDPQLIESYIYELNGLQKQYDFLLSTYRKNQKEQQKSSFLSNKSQTVLSTKQL